MLPAHEGRPSLRHHLHVGPRGVSRQVRGAPAQWRQVLRLSHLRLHALPGGQSGERHPLPVHSRIRDASGAQRSVLLAAGRSRLVQARDVGVCSMQHHLQRHVQAQAEQTGDGRARQRMGRSSSADARGPATPRVHAYRGEQVLRGSGRHPQRQRAAPGPPGELHPRRARGWRRSHLRRARSPGD